MKTSSVLFVLTLGLAASTSLAQFTPGRVVVLQCNNTVTTGNSGSLLEYLPSVAGQTTPTISVALPSTGGNAIVFGGSSSVLIHGLSRTPDGAFVVIPGFANTTAAAIDSSAGTESARVVATVKYDGTYSRPISSSTALSGTTMRSASSDGWGNFWAMGGSAGTIWMNGPTTVQPTTGRATIVENGNLYYTLAAGIQWFGGGTPTTLTPGSLLMTAADMGGTTAPAGFAIAPAPGTIAYLANYQSGNGIARYNWNGSSWVFAYKFTIGEDVPHIAVDFSQSPPVLYAVGATLSKLYAVTDPGVAGATTPTILATAVAPAKFRGVALAPVQPAAPVFTVHPATQCVDPGNTLVLGPVAATGANPNAWTWKLGTTALTDGTTPSGSVITGSTNTTLTISNFKGTDYGTYAAVAANNGGTATSSGAVITPCGTCITIPPSDTTNIAGTTAHFTVAHACVSPTYTWYHGTSVLTDGGNISGAATASLSIANVQQADAGNYTIKITHASGESSAGAALTVLDLPAINPQPPAETKAAAGTTASICLGATGGSLHYQWSKQGVGEIAGATASCLALPSLADGDAGSYRCVVTNLAGTATSDWAMVIVGHAPAISTPPVSITVTAGVSAVFSSTATGTATLLYSWKHNSDVISDDGHYSGTGTATLTIDNVQAADAGSYTVTAGNDYGNASATAVLKVVTALPKPHTIPGLVIYEPFDYPAQAYPPFPAPAGWVNSWENIISTWNQVTGEPAYWEKLGNVYCTIRDSGLTSTGKYPWKGIDCSVDRGWYWSSAPNNNHLRFGGIDQTNGAAYFSFVFQATQGGAMNDNGYDLIAGLTTGTGTANADNWVYKLCTHNSNGGDGYQLGLFKGGGATINASSANGQWVDTYFGRGSVHFIVGCYKFNSGTNLVGGSLTNDDVVSLWIDPHRTTFGAAESSLPTPNVGGTLNNWGVNAPITEFALKGTVPPASKTITDLRIGTTWASVTHPYYPTIRFTYDVSGLTLAWPAKDSGDAHGTGYVLQESADLLSWNLSGYAPTQDGSEMKVTVGPGSGPFFRLIYP